MDRVYGYVLTTRAGQRIEHQIDDIHRIYPNCLLYEEHLRKEHRDRSIFRSLVALLEEGDTLVTHSITRIADDAEESIELYDELIEKGVNLVFLREHHLDSSVFISALYQSMDGECDEKLKKQYMNCLRLLSHHQITIAFENHLKETQRLQQRTAEGIRVAREKGKQIGQRLGSSLVTKKSIAAKELILKYCKEFGGNLKDSEVIRLANVSRNSFYKYKQELKASLKKTKESEGTLL